MPRPSFHPIRPCKRSFQEVTPKSYLLCISQYKRRLHNCVLSNVLTQKMCRTHWNANGEECVFWWFGFAASSSNRLERSMETFSPFYAFGGFAKCLDRFAVQAWSHFALPLLVVRSFGVIIVALKTCHSGFFLEVCFLNSLETKNWATSFTTPLSASGKQNVMYLAHPSGSLRSNSEFSSISSHGSASGNSLGGFAASALALGAGVPEAFATTGKASAAALPWRSRLKRSPTPWASSFSFSVLGTAGWISGGGIQPERFPWYKFDNSGS